MNDMESPAQRISKGIVATIAVVGGVLFGLTGLVYTVSLFVSGHIGAALVMLFIGEPILMTLGYWLTMLLALPFIAIYALTGRRHPRDERRRTPGLGHGSRPDAQPHTDRRNPDRQRKRERRDDRDDVHPTLDRDPLRLSDEEKAEWRRQRFEERRDAQNRLRNGPAIEGMIPSGNGGHITNG